MGRSISHLIQMRRQHAPPANQNHGLLLLKDIDVQVLPGWGPAGTIWTYTDFERDGHGADAVN